MPSKRLLTGINIQFPISQLIINGDKVIETRKYPIPEKYVNQEMAFVETPGKERDFKSRVIAIIKFTSCFKYKSKKDFYLDSKRHCVTRDSKWAWVDGEKWGWNFEIVKILRRPQECTVFGIVYRQNLEIDIET